MRELSAGPRQATLVSLSQWIDNISRFVLPGCGLCTKESAGGASVKGQARDIGSDELLPPSWKESTTKLRSRLQILGIIFEFRHYQTVGLTICASSTAAVYIFLKNLGVCACELTGSWFHYLDRTELQDTIASGAHVRRRSDPSLARKGLLKILRSPPSIWTAPCNSRFCSSKFGAGANTVSSIFLHIFIYV